jgi:carbamoyltransferase
MGVASYLPNITKSHAASAFYPSPINDAAILTMDGVGDGPSSYGVGRDNDIELLAELHFPHSLGIILFGTYDYTGFQVNLVNTR